MPIRKIKIDIPYRNIDENQIADNLYLLQDCYLDESFAIHKRPGFEEFADTGTDRPGLGTYWWQEESSMLAVTNGKTFKITDSNGTLSEITNGTALDQSTRSIFTKVADSANNNNDTVFIANGVNPVYTTGSGLIQFPTGVTGSPPTKVTHVTSLDNFLALNDLDNKTLWNLSDATTPLDFTGAIEVSAQAKTDDISGLYQNGNFIWVQGADSIESFYDSEQSQPWIAVPGGLVETGTVNPYAIGIIDKTSIYLSKNRDVVTIGNGYNPVILSLPYAKRLESLSSVRDVEVDVMTSTGGKKLVLFNFQDAKTTLVYDYSLKLSTGKDIWYEWGFWDKDDNEYKQFKFTNFQYCPDWNLYLCQHRENGKIYKMSTDLTSDDGDEIRTEIITGIYGSPLFETIQENIYLDTRKGDGLTADKYTAPKCYFQFKDNKYKSWSNQIEIDLGKVGQSDLDIQKLPGGNYHTRQYRILHMDKSKFVLNGLYEQVQGKPE